MDLLGGFPKATNHAIILSSGDILEGAWLRGLTSDDAEKIIVQTDCINFVTSSSGGRTIADQFQIMVVELFVDENAWKNYLE